MSTFEMNKYQFIMMNVRSMNLGSLTARRSGNPNKFKTCNNATSVLCPICTPSSSRAKAALLHSTPISIVFFKAGDMFSVV